MLIEYQGKTPRVSPEAFVAPTATLIGDVEVGPNASIWFGAVLRADLGRITIGPGSSIQDNAVIHADSGKSVIVGEKVTIGHGAVLHGCAVKDGAVVGARSVILDGAVIGEQAVIAAGSVVTPGVQIPPRTLSAGVPAEVKKEVSGESLRWAQQGGIEYLKLTRTYLEQGIDKIDPAQKGSLPRNSRCRKK